MMATGLFDDVVVEERVNWNDMAVSLEFDERRIIKAIMKLHNNGRTFDVDPTYSRGVFWEGLPKPKHRFDINPQCEGVEQADARALPLDDCSVDSIMFDPPFVLKDVVNRKVTGIIETRFFAYKNSDELWGMYKASLREFYRVLRPNGIVAFKCQDTISGGKQYWSHIEVHKMATEIGFYGKDMFIIGRHNVLWSPNMKNQLHARKNHSYYWVFKK